MAGVKLSTITGGGGSIVGSQMALHVTDTNGLYLNKGEAWLRSGIIETTVADYPLALQGDDSGTSYVGLITQEVDISTHLPIYIRIK